MITSDPAVWIVGAALVSAAIGFFAAALMASHTIKRSRRYDFWQGYAACNRDHARSRSHDSNA